MPAAIDYDAILADEKNLVCTCHLTECRFRNNCRDCVAVHRYTKTIPNCLKSPEERGG